MDDYIIGNRTAADKTLRHLTLTLTGEERVFVRLYDGDEFVDDCEIDPSAYQGPLTIKDYVITKSEEAARRVIGSYEIVDRNEIGLVEIQLKIDGVEEIQYYSIQNEAGNSLISEERKVPITDSFTYLGFLQAELENVKIICFDAAENEKYTAYFDNLKYEIYVIEE